MLRTWLLPLLALFVVPQLWAQDETPLYGYLVEYPSQKPLPDLSVMSRGSNPTTTLSDGSFTLTYRGKIPGDKVFLTINQVIYRIARFEPPIEVFLRKNAYENPFTIELCREGQCPEDEIRREIMQGLQGKVDEINAEIRRLPANSKRIDLLQDSLAQMQMQIREMEGTIRDLSRQIARSEFDPALPVKKQAVVYLKRGLIDSAIYVLEQAEVKQNLRRIVAEEGKLEEELERIKSQKTEHIGALLTLARSYALGYQRDSAIATYRMVIEAEANNYQHHYELAMYLKRIKYYELAIDEFSLLIGQPLQPANFRQVYFELSDLYGLRGKHFQRKKTIYKAIRYFEDKTKNATNYPKDYLLKYLAEAYSRMGNWFLEDGNIDSAIYFHKKDMALIKMSETTKFSNDDLLVTLGNLGFSYMQKGDLDSAYRFFRKHLHLATQSNGTRMNVAVAYQFMGMWHYFSPLNNLDSIQHYYRKYQNLNREIVSSEIETRNNVSKNRNSEPPPDTPWTPPLGKIPENENLLKEPMPPLSKLLGKLELNSERTPSTEELYNLAISLSKEGEYFQRKGALDSTLYYFNLYFKITKLLFSSDSQNLMLMESLGIARLKLGEIYLSLGKLDSAIKSIEIASQHFQFLYDTEPDVFDWANGYAVTKYKLRILYNKRESFSHSDSLSREVEEIKTKLYESYPSNRKALTNLLYYFLTEGGIYLDRNELKKAQTYLRKGATLATAENRKIRTYFDISYPALFHGYLARVHHRASNLDSAKIFYQLEHRAYEKLAFRYPTNAYIRNNWFSSIEIMGEIYAKNGDSDSTLLLHLRKRDYFTELAKVQALPFRDLLAEANTLGVIATLYKDLRKIDSSRAYLHTANTTLQTLYKINPTDSAKYSLAISWEKLGDFSLESRDYKQAETQYEKALFLFEELPLSDPNNLLFTRAFGIILLKRGKLGELSGKIRESTLYYSKALREFEQLYQIEPTSEVENLISEIRNTLDNLD